MNHDFLPEMTFEYNVPLSLYNTLRIGGQAKYLMQVSTQEQLITCFHFCKTHRLRWVVLGHGSNVFFPQNGFDGLVVINKCEKIYMGSRNEIIAEAGVALDSLLHFALENALGGLEVASGIPGTVGGALFGNAGAYGHTVGEFLVEAKVITPDGGMATVDKDFFQFAYRESALKRNHAVVIQASFLLSPDNPENMTAKMEKIINIRRQKLPDCTVATAGSYFKNLRDEKGEPLPAAVLLDAVEAKQMSVGDVAIYAKHANIFYNAGHATADQVLALESLLKDRVYQKFGIRLEREVIYIE